jgi:hypothetical protein
MSRRAEWGHWALALVFLVGAGASLGLGSEGPRWWLAVGVVQLLLCALEVSSAVQAGRRKRADLPTA